jgi:hypothetical protein
MSPKWASAALLRYHSASKLHHSFEFSHSL